MTPGVTRRAQTGTHHESYARRSSIVLRGAPGSAPRQPDTAHRLFMSPLVTRRAHEARPRALFISNIQLNLVKILRNFIDLCLILRTHQITETFV